MATPSIINEYLKIYFTPYKMYLENYVNIFSSFEILTPMSIVSV